MLLKMHGSTPAENTVLTAQLWVSQLQLSDLSTVFTFAYF